MSREKKIKQLIEEVEAVDNRSTDELQEELRKKLQELRDKKMLPKKYAKTVVANLGISENTVFHAISGKDKKLNLEVAAELIKLAKERKELELLDEADELLKP